MNVPAHIKARRPQERLERFVTDTRHILAKRRGERVLEARERALKELVFPNESFWDHEEEGANNPLAREF